MSTFTKSFFLECYSIPRLKSFGISILDRRITFVWRTLVTRFWLEEILRVEFLMMSSFLFPPYVTCCSVCCSIYINILTLFFSILLNTVVYTLVPLRPKLCSRCYLGVNSYIPEYSLAFLTRHIGSLVRKRFFSSVPSLRHSREYFYQKRYKSSSSLFFFLSVQQFKRHDIYPYLV